MSDLPLWLAILVSVFLVLSGIISVTGALGLVRLKHFYSRIHAPTLGNTLGVFFMLLAMALLFSYLRSKPIVHPLIITVLLVLTSPVTAILLMRAGIKRERKQRTIKYGPDEVGHMDLPTKQAVLVSESNSDNEKANS